MMMKTETKERVNSLIGEAVDVIPETMTADLPPIDGYVDSPRWHPFEHKLWKFGEDIRQIINAAKYLRGDVELYDKFFRIAADKKGKRGRQSFILLFCYKSCGPWANRIAELLPDTDIDGHVISALYKMKAKGFSKVTHLYAANESAWIRKEAQRYLEFDADTELRASSLRR